MISDNHMSAGHSENDSSTLTNPKNAYNILKQLRIKNVNKLVIANLNINSIAPKFEQLNELISINIDILVITETKLDDSFSSSQFIIEGYSVPYRFYRNRNGGGILIYVREDIPSKRLFKYNFSSDI